MREYTHFTLPNRKIILGLALASLVSMAVYLAASALYYRIGFPLDDSWIHLTYARNLALYGEWAFRSGTPSAGSTAPLWTALLSIGFILEIAPYIWTYLLGTLLLWGMGLFGEMAVRLISPAYQSRIPWVGLFLIAEWHLAWSSVSGMETLLHALIITIVLGMLMSGSRRFMTLGLLAGLSVWVRPDGITLLGPVVVHALVGNENWKKRSLDFHLLLMGFSSIFAPSFYKTLWKSFRAVVINGAWKKHPLSLLLIGFLSVFVPYLLFNLLLAGTPMPNTFYAKQAEYSIWQARPFLSRFGELSLQFFAGPSLALLPGVIGWFVVSLRKRDWSTLATMVWFSGYLFLYVERLPAYQHGRYVMPAMPIFFLWGLIALTKFMRSELFGRYQWAAVTTWKFMVGSLCLAFWLCGAYFFAQDVALIESEMVASAQWVSKNVPQGEIVAAHDIGALGYYDNHELIDLAGLVSPEVIPFIRDEERLTEYLDISNVAYLIVFPETYPLLSELAKPAFVTGGIGPKLKGENMVVFHWR